MLFLANPIGIIVLVNYIKTIPTELDEAAALDGCGYFRFVIRVDFRCRCRLSLPLPYCTQ